MRIVVVDDDRGVRESLRRSLELNGYTVELAEDGQKAMDAVTRQRPDAMVLDMMMPRLGGLEVCRRLRSAGDDLPVLLLTARDAVSDRVAGLDAGADDYLPKPFILEELLARLRALLRRSTFDQPGNPGAAVGDVKSVTPSHPVKRHVRPKTRLTTKIIGAASVIVAAIGLIPPFAGAFWASNAPDSKVSHSNAASCFIIRSISDVNGIPQAIAFMNFQVETHARGQEYTYWLLVTLMLTDGSLRTEETQIEETPAVVIFPLDLLSRDSKRHNLMVDVDSARVSDVPMGACL